MTRRALGYKLTSVTYDGSDEDGEAAHVFPALRFEFDPGVEGEEPIEAIDLVLTEPDLQALRSNLDRVLNGALVRAREERKRRQKLAVEARQSKQPTRGATP